MTTDPAKLKKIIVRPRWRLAEIDPDTHYIVVSISDPAPFGKPAKIPQRWGLRDVLRLEFFDVKYAEHAGSMRSEHGQQIADFVRKHRDIETMVIHCEAGASRSPSVAIAICDSLGLDRAIVDWKSPEDYLGIPNAHVYEMTMEGFSMEAKANA